MILKKFKSVIEKNRLWIIVIFILNLIFGFLLWLVNDEAFLYILPTMIIGSLILYCGIAFVIYKEYLKRENEFREFLGQPNKDNENELLRLFCASDRKVIEEIGHLLRENQATIQNQKKAMDEYQEYIETWAHEIKTPLGLMTFVLDNRKDEIPELIYKRLDYSRTKIHEDIERMLYYARLKSSRNDYFLKRLTLKDICMNVIDEYEIILKEHGIKVIIDIEEDLYVFSDQKGIQFIIRQIISNSIKYKDNDKDEPQIIISSEEDEERINLIIRDNGIGVKAYDLPFIFEKGFTGEIGEQRKNSTGMGLYIANHIAEGLNVKLDTMEEYSDGFKISIIFPKIKRNRK